MKRLLLIALFLSANAFPISASKVWQVPAGGNKPSWGVVPKAAMPAAGLQVSDDCGTYSNATTSYTDVTNLTVTITTTGRPVMLMTMSDPGQIGGSSIYVVDASGSGNALVKFLRDSDVVGTDSIGGGASGFHSGTDACGAFAHIDQPSAGTYTYKVQMRRGLSATSTAGCNGCVLVAYEM